MSERPADEQRGRLCAATTAKGNPCRAYALPGSDKCSAHLGVGAAKSKLTPQLVGEIAFLVATGNYVEIACAATGVSRRSFHAWLKRGESEERGDALYREFRAEIERARAQAEARNVAMVSRAATENWQAAVWFLERQHPERWARVTQRDKDGEDVPTAVDDPFAELDELAEKRIRRRNS